MEKDAVLDLKRTWIRRENRQHIETRIRHDNNRTMTETRQEKIGRARTDRNKDKNVHTAFKTVVFLQKQIEIGFIQIWFKKWALH
jgi:hypothetical protein